MTATQFGRQCLSYYGSWKVKEHADSVGAYVHGKSEAFVSALWDVLKERRDPKEGPPSLPSLLALSTEAVGRMGKYQAPYRLTDGEVLSKAEAAEALEAVYAKLRGKVAKVLDTAQR